MKLPTRKELPDYYEVIRRPVDIFKIQGKIDDGKVSTLAFLNKRFMTFSSVALNHLLNGKVNISYFVSITVR